jgi:cell division protease FtsH
VLIGRKTAQGQQSVFGFGKSRAKLYTQSGVRITFDDVAGLDEAKRDLQDIIDFLRDPARLQRLGGRIPRGVLLVGPSGTGKTLLARAVAGEAQVPFFSISGSEFVEMLVGVGASRVRDLFAQAKAQPGPSIIFIDEIDAIGRRRVEMDGFEANATVIVLAATNRADILDPALLRPGRFDRQVPVDAPERAGREAILRVHARKLPVSKDVDFPELARETAGMVGADLANLVNEAALLAAKRSLSAVDQQSFHDALSKIQLGAERPFVLTAEERKVVAYHEAGHALAALLLPHADPLNRVSIVPRGHALGVTLQLPIDDRHSYSKAYLLTRIAVALGGRVSEKLAFGEITTGAENDLQLATTLIRQMVTRWGMTEPMRVAFEMAHPDGTAMAPWEVHQSEFLARQVDHAVQEITAERFDFTTQLLAGNRSLLDRLAALLLEHESLDGEVIRRELGVATSETATERVAEAVEVPAAGESSRRNGSGGH